jgi:hypothetical protein
MHVGAAPYSLEPKGPYIIIIWILFIIIWILFIIIWILFIIIYLDLSFRCHTTGADPLGFVFIY